MQTLTTPFGRRPMSLGHLAMQMRTDQAKDDAAQAGSNTPSVVNKWALFRTLTAIREQLGVSDRSLGLLNALLSFHPETALTLALPFEDGDQAEDAGYSCDLIVFPSNRALALRAHGMAEKTLRRHLAMLVDAGLIIRRDSPNGKRYARKDVTGAERFSDAFGFDLSPLVARAPEFEAMADEVRRAARARAVLKERISLHRRDVAKLITLGLDEGLPGPWDSFRQRFMGLVTPLRRLLDDSALAQTAEALAALRQDVTKVLEEFTVSGNMTGNDGVDDRHQSDSNTNVLHDFELASEESRVEVKSVDRTDAAGPDEGRLPLGLVLEACPDVREYGPSGAVRDWAAFLEAAGAIRPMLGISPDAWRAARDAMGKVGASIAVALILQRSEFSSEARTFIAPDGKTATDVNGSPAVLSPGGYLRALTEKATAGQFSAGPVLMALIGQRLKAVRAKGQGS